jgi:hypothetical protein
MRRTSFGVLVTTLLGLAGVAVPATPALAIAATPPLIISEFRYTGLDGVTDEYVEIYNASGSAHTVAASDMSAGYALAASDGVTRFVIPNGTIIPAHGHYLGVNSDAYSLTPAGDTTFTTDIPVNVGIALFKNATGGASFSTANRIDAVGATTEANTTYKEGTGLPALTDADKDQAWVRVQDATNAIVDTGTNASDFMYVDTNGSSQGAGQRLGAPGPENAASPPFHGGDTLAISRIDTTVSATDAPNFVRDFTSDGGNNSTFGTVKLRRLITNNTGAALTRLRIRLSDVSTFPAVTGTADLRGRSSTDETVATDGGPVATKGTTVEQPPAQLNGAGFNSTLSVPTVTLGTPLANGASVAVDLLFGVQQSGVFRLGLEFDSLPGGGASADICGATDVARPTDVCVLPPVNTTPASRSLVGTTSFTGGAVAVTDYAEDTSLKVTLTATHGTLTLDTTGLTFSAGDGTDDVTTTFVGTIVDLNTALDTLVYTADAGYLGVATLTVESDDEGKTWPSPHVNVVDAAGTDTDEISLDIGTLQISEFRVRGPNGANDEFVEIRNPTDSPFSVQSSDGSSGFSVAASNGVGRFTIPNDTVIPAFGHYLGVNSVGYSLASNPAGNGTTATGDATYTTDIPDNAGIALFNTATAASFDLLHRIDAVGSATEANTVYKEGTGYPALTPFSIDYSFYRSLKSGAEADTDDNAADFVFVDSNGTSAGAGQRLGVPGPENSSSPTRDGSANNLALARTDPDAGYLDAPNVVIDTTSDPANNSTFGTLSIRRRVTNTSGAAATRLRFRIREITTFPSPSGVADLRPRTSTAAVVPLTEGGDTTAVGTTLEQPPSQPNGGGFNSSLSVGTVTLATPLANGASVDTNLLFGIQQTGRFRLGLAVESLPEGASSTFTVCGNTDDGYAFAAAGDLCPQPPVLDVPGAQATSGSTPVVFTGPTSIFVADADDDEGSITLASVGGKMSLGGVGGLTFTVGNGTDDTAMAFKGSLDDLNAALDGLTYVPDTGFSGAGSIAVGTNDGGSAWTLLGVTDPARSDAASVTINVNAPSPGDFFSVPPTRIMDTRAGLGAPLGRVGPGGQVSLKVTGVGGVPSTGVSAVFVNVTETANTAAGYVTVWPNGGAVPGTSNLNYAKHQIKANEMVVKVGVDGRIRLRNTGSSAHLIVDVVGYATTALVAGGGKFKALARPRIVDTRTGQGTTAGRVPPNSSITVKITGANGIPASGVGAVLVNLTAVNSTASGYLTVHAANVARPPTSSINFQTNQSIANMLITQVSPAGEVTIYNSSGSTHVLFDLVGYYSDGNAPPPAGGNLTMLSTPKRVVDSRSGIGTAKAPMGPSSTRTIDLTGVAGIPASGVGSVVINITAANTTGASYFTQYPANESLPVTSALDWQPGQGANNYIVAKVGPGGLVKIYNYTGKTALIVDVVGWYAG